MDITGVGGGRERDWDDGRTGLVASQGNEHGNGAGEEGPSCPLNTPWVAVT